MQLVSHYLQRPAKKRLPSEKSIVPFFDLCVLIQATAIIVHSVTFVDSGKQTLKGGVLSSGQMELQGYLGYKLGNCMVNITTNLNAFTNVTSTVSGTNFYPILADYANQMRLGMILGIIAVVVGAFNRLLLELNTFVLFSFRNLIIWKDIVSAVELVLLGLLFGLASSADYPRGLLKEFFSSCGVKGKASLPFISLIPLYICGAGGFLAYAVSLILYLIHTLPKYGVLNEDEIEDYKARLQKKIALQAQTKAQWEKAIEEHARLQLQIMDSDLMYSDLKKLADEGKQEF